MYCMYVSAARQRTGKRKVLRSISRRLFRILLSFFSKTLYVAVGSCDIFNNELRERHKEQR